jgi:dihydroflavonol-4-reductase
VHSRPVEGADETARGDLEDVASLEGAVHGADAVVHLAAVTHARSPRAYDRVNVEGTLRLLAAIRAGGTARVLHVSTRAIDPDGGAYSRSKAHAERAVREAGVPYTIVRLPEVYGAGGREGVDAIVARARSGRRILVVGDGGDEVCPIVLEDAVAALAAALERDEAIGKTYTLAGECMSVRAFAERCAAAFRTQSRISGVPVPLVAALSRLARLAPLPLSPDQLDRLRAPKPRSDPTARDDLGFEPRRLEEAL